MSDRGPCHVVIPTYKRSELLDRTLYYLSRCQLPDSLKSVTVVENAAQHGAEQICARYVSGLPLHYLFNPRPGKSRAIQFWLDSCAPTGLVIMFDDDIRVSENCLIAYEQLARQHGPGAYFGGAVGIDFEQPPPAWIRKHLTGCTTGYETFEQLPGDHDQVRFLGFNMAVHIEDLIAAGGMNPYYGPGAFTAGAGINPTGSEMELQTRLQAHGIEPIFEPTAKVWHYVPVSRCSSAWLLTRRFRNAASKSLSSPDPRAHLRRLGKQSPRMAFKYLLSFLPWTPEKRFILRSKPAAWAGGLMGLCQRRKLK